MECTLCGAALGGLGEHVSRATEPCKPEKAEGAHDETDVSAKQKTACEDARFSYPHENASGPGCNLATPAEGPQTPGRLNGPAGESNDSEPAPETFSKDQRIRRRSDYNRIYEEGRKLHGRYVVIFVIPGGTSRSRLGITVTKKAGRAHDRNQLKRRVREIFRRAPARKELDESPIDIVVNVKPAAKVATFEDLERDLIGAIRRAKRHGES